MSDKRFRFESDGNGGFVGWIEDAFTGGEFLAIIFAIIALLACGWIYVLYKLITTKVGRIILVILIICTAIVGVVINAQYERERELNRYNLERILLDDGTYEICGMGKYEDKENLVIPSEYDGIPVTSIGEDAFKYYGGVVKSVTIPNSVTRIGDRAFKDCKVLESVTIANSVTSIGNNAFENCDSLKSIKIPNSVTSIGDEAFDGCDSLTDIVIPDSVTNIGNAVFQWCSSLTNVILPNNMDNIPQHMFYCCDSLKSIDIPNGVTRIERCAFASCDSLASVNIPKSVNYIGELAFARINSTLIFNYLGTKSQWEAIEKVNTWSSIDGILNWDYGTYNYTVSCTNGTISK